MPTLAAIHANAPSTTTNCAQCHGAAAPTSPFRRPTSASSACRPTTSRPAPPAGLPRRRWLQRCRRCHAQRRQVLGSRMSPPASPTTAWPATGRTSPARASPVSPHHRDAADLADGLRRTSRRAAPASCHPRHAGQRQRPDPNQCDAQRARRFHVLFATPAPTGRRSTAGITSGCSGCHEAGYVWMGVNAARSRRP